MNWVYRIFKFIFSKDLKDIEYFYFILLILINKLENLTKTKDIFGKFKKVAFEWSNFWKKNDLKYDQLKESPYYI